MTGVMNQSNELFAAAVSTAARRWIMDEGYLNVSTLLGILA
jgi:hypothetical protein